MSPKETSTLKVMFPEEEVELFGGRIVKVRPLSLKDIPKVIESFKAVMKIASETSETEKTKDMTSVASAAAIEIMNFIPYCVNCEPEEIPMQNVPEILSIIVKQNLTGASGGNWMTLISTVTNLLEDQGIPTKISKKS